MRTLYEVTLKLEFGEMNALEDALRERHEELMMNAANAERRADQRKARGLGEDYREMNEYLLRAAQVQAAINALAAPKRA